MNNWHKYIDNNEIIGCITIDLCKAFDLVNFNIMCKKLKLYGCSDITISWFHLYLNNRKQIVCIDDFKSTTLNNSHGIPQGSILGPLLFILFINDLPLCLLNSHMHMYADDTSIYASRADVDTIQYNIQ